MVVEVTLGGRSWKIDTHAPIRKCWGYCHYRNNTIQVSKRAWASGKARDVLIHECLHAIFPYLNENEIDRAGTELDKMLTACYDSQETK